MTPRSRGSAYFPSHGRLKIKNRRPERSFFGKIRYGRRTSETVTQKPFVCEGMSRATWKAGDSRSHDERPAERKAPARRRWR